MDNNPLISIIVPVYNVAEYLPRCIESIMSQTYTNLEIILVDDGSADESGNICEQYAQKDTRIRVVHKINGGLSSARNAGLDIMTGGWFGFVDSDDYIKPQMYEKLIEAALKNDTVLAMCADVKYFADGRVKEKINTEFPAVISGEYIIRYWAENHKKGGRFARSVTKLYNKALLCDEDNETIRFDESILHSEDLPYVLYFYSRTDRISYIPEALYIYCVRENSIATAQVTIKTMTRFNAYDKVISLIADISKKHARMVKCTYTKMAFDYLRKSGNNATRQEKEIKSLLKKCASRYFFYYWLSGKHPIREKILNTVLLLRI